MSLFVLFSFVFTREGYPIVAIWLIVVYLPRPSPVFMPDAITFPLAHHLRPASGKLLLLGHLPNQ